MAYKELLTQKEWYDKCNHILQRDKYTCQDCGCIGYHNKTIYTTDSIEEVDSIINEKILIGDRFSSLIEQTFKGYTECDKVNLTLYYLDTEGNKCPANETEREKSLKGYVRWEPYNNVKIIDREKYGELYVSKIDLHKMNGFYFSYIFEEFGYTTIITNENIGESLNFHLHRYRKFRGTDRNRTTYPMAILKFDYELTDKYCLSIEDSQISLTYRNYVFYVCLSAYQFVYKGLNVHHKYYVYGKKPWEYEEKALVTLCEDCHQKRHDKPVPLYRTLLDQELIKYCYKCDRCGGSGYIPQYKHVKKGICFKCMGEGTVIE